MNIEKEKKRRTFIIILKELYVCLTDYYIIIICDKQKTHNNKLSNPYNLFFLYFEN
jgi:hypothetical protein